MDYLERFYRHEDFNFQKIENQNAIQIRRIIMKKLFDPPAALISFFWGRVIVGPKNECWPWVGTIHINDGYGRANGILPHRISYAIHHGPFNDNFFVLQRCKNKICMNPDHLFLSVTTLTDEMIAQAKWQASLRLPHRDIATLLGVSLKELKKILKSD